MSNMINRVEYIIHKLTEYYVLQEEGIKESIHPKSNSFLGVFDIDDADISEEELLEGLGYDDLIKYAENLNKKYLSTNNRFTKIKAAMFLSRIYSFYLPGTLNLMDGGIIPYDAICAIDNQDYDEALTILSKEMAGTNHISEALMRATGSVYWKKAFQLIEEQVSVSFSLRYPELFAQDALNKYSLRLPDYFYNNTEVVRMPVRIEHTSCVGSDIFFLAMDRPQKARCINISVDIAKSCSDDIEPPITVALRPIKEAGIRITSIDLDISKLIQSTEDLFNFRNDDVSLIKAALAVSGIVPPALKEASEQDLLKKLLDIFIEHPDFKGFEIITRVKDIPRGSGLAVSTSLLAATILALLRFSGQVPYQSLEIDEDVKMDVVARCIYGEWLGGSGGGWQDAGGLWGGFKKICAKEADPVLEPDSRGAFLPVYSEMKLNNDVIRRITDSLVLVNGGTGQDVGPVLRMNTEKYILRQMVSWEARKNTENRFDKIEEALYKGDVKELGILEIQYFTDRTKISILANNIYHQMVYERLKDKFGDDLWGYDSTGGRAGAGGIYFVNPCIRKDFEDAFISFSNEAQNNLEGQMHFSSRPIVYRYKINENGVTVLKLSYDTLEMMIEEWKSNKKNIKQAVITVSDKEIDTIKEECGYTHESFVKLQKLYKEGAISLKGNMVDYNGEIKPLSVGLSDNSLHMMPLIGTKEYDALFKEGIDLFTEPMAYIMLNGGESTRFGANTIRGLNPSFYISGKFYSMIELKIKHLNFLQKRYSSKIYAVFVNSFFTNKQTQRVLMQNNFFNMPDENIFHCMHQVIHRVNPRKDDLLFWHENIRERSLSRHEEDLARQYLDAMLQWTESVGEDEIYKPEGLNKIYTLVSPGHYYSFMSLVSTGTLGHLIKRGVKRIIVSSNDNLLSTIDPAILAYHKRCNRGTTVEVVSRLFDKGGAPVLLNNAIKILEDISFPDKQSMWNTEYFNPITTWMEVDSLLELLMLDKSDVIEAAEGNPEKLNLCTKSVDKLAEKIKTYVVLKHIADDMGNGIQNVYPTVQFEKLYGDLVGQLNPNFLLVPKALRHTQMKTVSDIYNTVSDRTLDILKPQIEWKM